MWPTVSALTAQGLVHAVFSQLLTVGTVTGTHTHSVLQLPSFLFKIMHISLSFMQGVF